MLRHTLVGLMIFGGLMLWRYGGNATMPDLAEEARLAPPPRATSVSFRPGAWACTHEEFKLQVLDHRSYYAKPVVIRITGNGPPEFCREINSTHDYALLGASPAGADAASPCPDHSCVAFNARLVLDGREDEWILYAPNSFIASSR
ncbi:hypothetical protein [Frateuria sp.]|uniref:hypothetical protein n=1 Tax=Frateuria sp. TaxID=2211372 RepID=UPI00179BCB48|nr:hypothetical protein [Frateuria sp.]NUR22087.1 hypothetical protein [Frateuria sp.]